MIPPPPRPRAPGAVSRWLMWPPLRRRPRPRRAPSRLSAASARSCRALPALTEQPPIGCCGCHSDRNPTLAPPQGAQSHHPLAGVAVTQVTVPPPFPQALGSASQTGFYCAAARAPRSPARPCPDPGSPHSPARPRSRPPSQSGTAPAPRSGPRLFVLQPLGDEVELVAPGLVAIGNADLGHVRLPNVIAIGPVFLVVFTQEPRFLLPEAKTEVPTSEAPLAAPEGSPEPTSGAGAIPRPWAGPPQKDTHLVGQETLQDTPCVGQDTHDVGEDTPHGTVHTAGHHCMGQDTPRGI